MTADTRLRIMDSSAELFRRKGYSATGVKQIVAEANAPFASLYHFFPGGKRQLGEEVIRRSGALYLELFATIAEAARDVPSGIADFFSGAGETLRDTGYADACPIATVALEVASTEEQLRRACAEVFESWMEALCGYLRAGGVPGGRVRALAFSVLSLLEGAFLFSRSMRATEPMDAAGASAVALVRAAIA